MVVCRNLLLVPHCTSASLVALRKENHSRRNAGLFASNLLLVLVLVRSLSHAASEALPVALQQQQALHRARIEGIVNTTHQKCKQ